MHRFMRWYNQNRAEFFVIIAIIAFAFVILQVLNSIVGKISEQKTNEISLRNSSTVNDSTTISKANQSIITGEKIGTQTSNINQNIIKQFVQYCNDVKVEEAYAMLSDECKEVLYPSLEDFVKKYFLKIFDISRMYSLENWYSDNSSYTYYIKYMEDILATGNINSSNNKNDYITVVYTDDGYKLNLSSYVGRQPYTKIIGRENVVIRVNYIDQYIDYTTLNITIRNNTDKTICIDSKEDPETLFVYDENNVKYSSLITELSEDELMIESNNTKTLNIRFSKIYKPERGIRGIVFSDVVLNYEAYSQGTEEKERITIKT